MTAEQTSLPIAAGQRSSSVRVLVYGERGVGLTTFLSGAQNVLFLSLDESTNQRHDLPQWQPEIETIDDLYAALERIAANRLNSDDPTRTIAIEGLEEIESMLVRKIEERLVARAEETDGPTTFDEYNEEERGGGYELVRTEWRKLLSRIDVLRRRTGMHIAMSTGLQREPMLREDETVYDRWKPAITAQRTANLIKRWFDYVLHLSAEEVLDETTKPPKRVSTRFLYCTQTPWHDCKAHGGIEWPERLFCDRVEGWRTFAKTASLVTKHGASLRTWIQDRAIQAAATIRGREPLSAEERRGAMLSLVSDALAARDYLRAIDLIEHVEGSVEP